jgi:poly-beta-1,6-N-acetyl-D-glucosamine synthase
VATLQSLVALALERGYDPTIVRAFLVAALYPLAYWAIAASAALRSQTVALVRGPRGRRVIWDIPRERIETGDQSPTRS